MEQSINALLMDEHDNVVTCVKEVKRGQSVAYQDGAELRTLVAEEDIPYCHKGLHFVIKGSNASPSAKH